VRIRAIKPEFWRSTDISDLEIQDRLLFIGLWSYVDDNGVGVFDVAIITAELFAHDLSREPIETLSRVSTGCERLSSEGLITLYKAENRDYLFITNWEAHQRVNNPNKPRFPRPDAENATLLRSDVDPKENLPPGTGEQGNRGTGESIVQPPAVEPDTPPRNNYPKDFETFWSVYPRRESKKDAHTAFKAAKKRAPLEQIMQGAERYRNDPNREQQFTKLPATWLRADGWEDDPLPPRQPNRQQTTQSTPTAALWAAGYAQLDRKAQEGGT